MPGEYRYHVPREILQLFYYDNRITDWAIALLTAAGLVVSLWLLKQILVHRLARITSSTKTQWDNWLVDTLNKTRLTFFIVLGVYVGSRFISLPNDVAHVIRNIMLIALFVQTAFWGNQLINLWLTDSIERHRENDAPAITGMGFVALFARLALWTILVLGILDNLGFNISALVAGLGIGGVAIALAVQSLLGDLFASLSITMDRPFVIGDFITVDSISGTVEHIGLKTTRVRSLSGEEIIFANTDLLKSRVQNYKSMVERRILFSFGVVYRTDPNLLERIPSMLREIIESMEGTRFDRAHFKDFGSSSLNFEVVYYVLSPDYNAYMDLHQSINLQIIRRFLSNGIEFAYPTRNVILENAADERPRPFPEEPAAGNSRSEGIQS